MKPSEILVAAKAPAYRVSEDYVAHHVPDGRVSAGTIVYRQRGHDYGLASDDSRVFGEPFRSVTLKEDGDYPGFTMPTRVLTPISGE